MYRMGRERTKEYKVDATKGKSKVDPRTFKGDVLVQVWVDSRVIATLSEWIDNTGNSTRYMSEVVKGILNAVLIQVVEKGEIEMIEWTTEARELLEKKYKVNLNPSGRGMKNVLHNELLSDGIKSADIEAGLAMGGKVSRPGKIVGGKIGEQTRQALNIYSKIKEDEKYSDEAKRLKKKDEDRLNALKGMDG